MTTILFLSAVTRLVTEKLFSTLLVQQHSRVEASIDNHIFQKPFVNVASILTESNIVNEPQEMSPQGTSFGQILEFVFLPSKASWASVKRMLQWLDRAR
jgi:hypothetical protein